MVLLKVLLVAIVIICPVGCVPTEKPPNQYELLKLPQMEVKTNGILKDIGKDLLKSLNPFKYMNKPFPNIAPLRDFDPYTCVPKVNLNELVKEKKQTYENPGEKLKDEWLKVKNIKVKSSDPTGFELFAEHMGETGGEAVSWALGIVSALAMASGVLSPAVGAFSLVAGIVTTIADNKWKEQIVKSMNNAFARSQDRLNQRMAIMEEYVDTNIALLEKGLLSGELSQMTEYLTLCLEKDDPMACSLDRCEYIQAGFKKFAIYFDEFADAQVSNVLFATEGDENDDLSFKSYKISMNKKRLESIQLAKIKRAFANLPLFEAYSSQLLYNCDITQFLSLILKNSPEKKEKLRKWFDSFIKRSNKVKIYVNSVASMVMTGYNDEYLQTKHPERVLDYGIEERAKDSNVYNLQCRIRMNPFNLEACDYKYSTELKAKELKNSDDQVDLLKKHCETEFMKDDKNNDLLEKNNKKYISGAQSMISGFQGDVIRVWENLQKSIFKKLWNMLLKKEKNTEGDNRNSIINAEITNNTFTAVL